VATALRKARPFDWNFPGISFDRPAACGSYIQYILSERHSYELLGSRESNNVGVPGNVVPPLSGLVLFPVLEYTAAGAGVPTIFVTTEDTAAGAIVVFDCSGLAVFALTVQMEEPWLMPSTWWFIVVSLPRLF
jgi:hypothetical protein